MVDFVAHPPGSQDRDTYRQFVELHNYVSALEERLRPVTETVTYSDMVLTDAWASAVLVSGVVPQDPGVYSAILTATATGSTANAEVQSRLVYPSTIIEQPVQVIGNNIITIIDVFYAAQAPSADLQFRGISASLSQITAYIQRIAA
jgi:hypothetical protein